ncbi:MAG TPA: alcohol dehydrogenase catalytic domain-containing protein [Rhizomicrobium sp.]|jgi:acrylyl-CoA reductase (NADPH)|nr:alcohol dehydrogenase catalytic domain-containing protein [Rhizomicrobium sp.]
MADFRAVLIRKNGDAQRAELNQLAPAELMEGDVTVAVSHSTVNYKDGLALTGRAPVVRRFPMIPGIDFAGVVQESDSPAYKTGDKVLLNGWGLGETHYGGYAELARVESDRLIPLAAEFSPAEAMAIGTAGYTAMLAVLALEEAGVTPEKGPVLVTGASGGVGSVAIALLAKLGFHVIASTGRNLARPKSFRATNCLGERSRWRKSAGRVQSTVWDRKRSPTCSRPPNTAGPWPPADWYKGWICPPALRRSFCAACRCWALSGLGDVFEAAEEILAGKVRGRLVIDMSR